MLEGWLTGSWVHSRFSPDSFVLLESPFERMARGLLKE